MSSSIIAHISTVHPPFDTRIFHKECKSLAKDGFDVKLIITHPQEEIVDNIHIIPLPLYKGRIRRIVCKPFQAFSKALKTKADIFHFHDPELIPVGLLLKLCGKKVIYDVHEDLPAQIKSKHWIPPFLRSGISYVSHCIESIGAKFFDGIICTTPHITNIFLKKNPNTINVNNYPLLDEILKTDPSMSLNKKEEKAICYTGAITELRGIYSILDAIEGTNIKLYLAGNASPGHLLTSLQQHKGWKNVTFFGHVNREKLYSILEKSHIGILLFHPAPNHLNCIPNKLFEYMGAGLPIIASDFPFWRELTKDLDNMLFVNPFDPKMIRDSIEDLLSDKEKWHTKGLKGLQAVKEKYNWEIEETKLITFYNKLGVKAS
ncbi:MAG: glycosyltransferase family 4 protein [Alphaproteobacteria bacterium]|nr:glycosyltransferase family 4 protein [Alphaproteobacteria bacterium]